MGSEWFNTQLSEIADRSDRAFAMGPFGSNIKAENYRNVGVPVVRGINLGGPGEASFRASEFVFLTEKKADELASSNAHPNDIVFVAQGTIGKVGIIPPDTLYSRFVLSQNLMKVTVDPEKADPYFVFYFFRSAQGQHEIMSRANPTGVPCISKPLTSLRQFGIQIPSDIEEQRAIAHILGTLDDKLELNRRMNETLESMARALFKSWFVDFDPVRAKMEGRWRRGESLPGLPAQLFDLFPDRLAPSELGEIPMGWEEGMFGDVAKQQRRSIRPHEINLGTPYIALEHMPKRCITLSEWATADNVGSNKYGFKKGEILFGKLRPYFHKVGVAPIDGVCSTDIVVVSPISQEWFGYVLGHISSDTFVKYTNASSTGTKMPRTNWNDMARYEIPLPDPELAKAFTEWIRPSIDHIVSTIHESHTLSEIRDTLLPKLISGELRVMDTERFVKEARI